MAEPYQDEGDFFDTEEELPCSMCRGTGVINALTNQDIIFVASFADCPTCDGMGYV